MGTHGNGTSERSERWLEGITAESAPGFPASFLGYHANGQKGLEGAACGD